MANIAFTGSHNSTFAVSDHDNNIVLVLEVERFLGYKNSGLTQYKIPEHPFLVIEQILNYIYKFTGYSEFDNCFTLGDTNVYINGVPYDISKRLNAKNFITTKHHLSHAGQAFYLSPFDEALIISFDGGGNDGTFNIYFADKYTNRFSKIKNLDLDLGFPYMVIGHYLEDIKFQPIHEGHLVYSGKLMGLVSYGKVRPEWVKPLELFCTRCKMAGFYDYEPYVKHLSETTGLELDVTKRLKGQDAYDLAATLQHAWENVFIEAVREVIEDKSRDPYLPICLAGGCALNILLNTRIKKEFNRNVFVGPVPNDSGLAVGMLLNYSRPVYPPDITYSGLPLLDLDLLPAYLNERDYFLGINYVRIVAQNIIEGKIIGVARGRSEIGPRGLGNRSILCNSTIPNMKDILNRKVKNREWYRPFAPVVRLEDVNKYFEWEQSSRWMSFAPKVKEEWKEKLPAITHVDGTARVQTVTREENPWLYELLTEMEAQCGVGVLLNTSFNLNGKPILTTVKDAFNVLDNTQLDGIVIENYYITKFRNNRNVYSPQLNSEIWQ